MKTLLSFAVATLLIGGFATAASAAGHKGHHARSCYDYAWDSQEQKDCLAKGDTQPAPAKKHHKKAAKEAEPAATPASPTSN